MAKRPFAWSYTALTGYETCPKQFYHLKVAKDIREEPSEAMLEGNRAHKALEERVRDGKPLPGKYSQYEPLCSKLEKTTSTILVEQRLALNENLEPTEFFAKDAWVRGVLDLALVKGKRGNLYDYKTGKRKPDNEQLKLFSAISMAALGLEEVKTFFLWLKTKQVDKKEFTKADESIIWQEFLPRVEDMAEAYEHERYPARENGLCGQWCPVITCKHNGGHRDTRG